MLLGVGVTLLGLGLGAPSARAEEVPCPGGTRSEPLSGALFRANPTKPHPVTMAPCETLLVSVTGAIVGQPAMGLSVQVLLKNPFGVTLASQSAWCYVTAGCAFTLPLATSASGTPLPGTAGAAGRVASVVVTLSLPPYTTVGVEYTGTAVLTSRPGFNTGSPTLATAPLLAASPAAITGSLHYLEEGQYSRVRLRAGGTLQVTGWLGITCTPCYGGAFSVAVFTSGGTYVSTIGSRGYGSNYGPSVPFTSSVFTNTTGQPAEFVLRLKVAVNPTPTLAEFALTVTWAEGPRLTLFLDREPNDPVLGFNAADPESDDATYVPGADHIGASVPLDEAPTPSAQAMELIAAYVDDAGAIVPPPPYAPAEVTFALTDTSAFRGYAMNAGESTAPDFSLPTPAAAFGADHTARSALFCHDYGGFTTVTVTDGWATTAGLRLPQNSGGNWLPDAGWTLIANETPYGVVTGIANLNRDEDSDDDPTDVPLSDGAVIGDGLVAFEEYRGFVVRGEHRRTNPYRKDLFIDSTVTYSIGDAAFLPLTRHWISPEERGALSATRRHVNANHDNLGAGGQFGHVAQQALVVRPSVGVIPGILGETDCPADPDPCTPNSIEAGDMVVYENTVRAESPSSSSEILVEALDEPAVRSVLGHEIGHGLNMPHPDDSPPFSIMDWATVWGYDWSQIPHGYLNRDTVHIRVR
jgi:hypothetical protein